MIGSIEAAKKIGIEIHRLYSWERAGILAPRYAQRGVRKFRYYSAKDIHKGRLVRRLMDEEGYTLQGAIKKLSNVRALK